MKPSFLLVTCSKDKNLEVVEKIKNNHGIKEALPVSGIYDCVVRTDDMSYDEVMELISSSIRPLNDVSLVLPLFTEPPELTNNLGTR